MCTLSQWVEFSSEVNHVSMSVAAAGTAAPVSVTLTAYDSGGNQIAGAGSSDTQTVSDTALTTLSVSAAGAATTVAYVQITANDGTQGSGFAFTDMSYGPVAVTPTPDFGLVNPGSTGGVVLNAGGPSVSETLILRRYGGSSGPIDFSYSMPPADVTAAVTPTPDDNGDGSDVTVTFTATAAATATSEFPVTIYGTPGSPSAGGTQHSIVVPVTIITPESQYGLRIQGLELTQGIQTFTLPTPTGLARTVPYSGVKLVAGMPAVVRVFADAINAPVAPPSGPNLPGNGLIPGVGVQLAATDAAGNPLPGSPLEGGMPPLFATGSATVPVYVRTAASGDQYDFDLPFSWLIDADSEPITLTATLTPPPLSLRTPSAAAPCTDPACVALQTFTLTGVTSLNVGETKIFTIFMENGGVTPDLGLWDSDVAWVRQLIPAGLQVSTLPYGTIDIDWIVNGCYKGKILGHVCFSRSAKNGEAHSEVEDFAHHQLKGVVDDQPIIGVSNPNAGGTTDLGVESGNIGQGAAAAVVDVGRPLTDVAHEIGHMFGLVHASKSCGGGTGGNIGQPWPPDQQGYIDGIGLNLFDPAPSQPGIYGPSYPVVAGTPPGDVSLSPPPQQFYDFMSYCASPNNNPDPSPGSSVNPAVDSNPADGALGNSDAWISVRNWDYIATEAACFNAGGGSHSIYKGCHAQADSAQGQDSNAAAAQQASEASVPPSAVTAQTPGPG